MVGLAGMVETRRILEGDDEGRCGLPRGSHRAVDSAGAFAVAGRDAEELLVLGRDLRRGLRAALPRLEYILGPADGANAGSFETAVLPCAGRIGGDVVQAQRF